MLPVCEDMISTLPKMCSGARRSFFCRMKCKLYNAKEVDTTTGSKYTQSGNFNSFSKFTVKYYHNIIYFTRYLLFIFIIYLYLYFRYL